jgi:probable rRNA maturation factor
LSGTLSIRNRQRAVPVDARQLRRITLALLKERLGPGGFELGIRLVGATEMTRLNETFLRHAGSTDVITFDHTSPVAALVKARSQPDGHRAFTSAATILHGELFICLDEAVRQARRFRTTWQSELVRYVVHGVLHLTGCDDRRAADRRKMKREENRLLRKLGRSFDFAWLAGQRAAGILPAEPSIPRAPKT